MKNDIYPDDFFEWDKYKNDDVKEALEWAEWLHGCKDPGPALLAAKKHAVTLAKAYYIMARSIEGTP
jgi:hypothetical protein